MWILIGLVIVVILIALFTGSMDNDRNELIKRNEVDNNIKYRYDHDLFGSGDKFEGSKFKDRV